LFSVWTLVMAFLTMSLMRLERDSMKSNQSHRPIQQTYTFTPKKEGPCKNMLIEFFFK
jgi:hypothetical protein